MTLNPDKAGACVIYRMFMRRFIDILCLHRSFEFHLTDKITLAQSVLYSMNFYRFTLFYFVSLANFK